MQGPNNLSPRYAETGYTLVHYRPHQPQLSNPTLEPRNTRHRLATLSYAEKSRIAEQWTSDRVEGGGFAPLNNL